MNIPRLLTKYRKEVVPAMRAKFGYKNIMQVPKIIKVVLNIGVGKHVKDDKMLANVEKDLALISGQKEVFEESVIIRDMGTGNQETVPLNKMVEVIKKKL